jgi:hypothetical protein
VKEKSEELEKTKTALEKLSSLRETSPIYFFKNKENFLTREIEKEALELTRITDKEIELKIEIDTAPPQGFLTEEKLLLKPFSFSQSLPIFVNFPTSKVNSKIQILKFKQGHSFIQL